MEIELSKYTSALKKRLWIILLLVGVASVSAYMYTKQMMPNYYAASNKIIINTTVEGNTGETMDFSSIGSNIKLIDTYKEILKTPVIMDKVAQLNPELNLTPKQLASMIQASSSNESQVMTLTATDTNYTRAVKAVNAVSKVFKDEIPKIMKTNNVTVLTTANENDPARPFGQNTRSNVMIAFFAALLLSSGIIILFEYLDQSIKSEDDILLTIGAETLAIVPKFKKKDLNLSLEKASHGQAAINARGQAL